jgi:hypothetical protein
LYKLKKSPNFFAEFGSFGHLLLERFAKGTLGRDKLETAYVKNFDRRVTASAPKSKNSDTRRKYYEEGLEYFRDCDFSVEDYEVLGVEKEVNFDIGGKNMVGYIDLLLKDKTGALIVVDHKSASYPMRKSGEVKKGSEDKLEGYKRQLYLYSKPVFEEYGEYPSELRWNFFRANKWYSTPFVSDEYDAALKWAADTMALIENEKKWKPNPEFFWCKNLCSVSAHCKYALAGFDYANGKKHKN